MNDKELVEALKRGSSDPKVQELAAARLDALRWRAVEEGEMPEPGWYVETVEFGEVRLRFAPLRITATHWRHVITPSREGGRQ